MTGLLSTFINLTMIVIVVLIHSEVLSLIEHHLLIRNGKPRRFYKFATVLVLIGAHLVEIAVCAITIYLCAEVWDLGALSGETASDLQTYLYYSFASYTSLGIGDIFPVGHLRITTGVEALLGLLMIGWSASFMLIKVGIPARQ